MNTDLLTAPNNNQLPPLNYKSCPFCESWLDYTKINHKVGYHDQYHCMDCGKFKYLNVHYEGDGPPFAHATIYKLGVWTVIQYWRINITLIENGDNIVLTLPKLLEVNTKNTFETIEKIKFYLTFS